MGVSQIDVQTMFSLMKYDIEVVGSSREHTVKCQLTAKKDRKLHKENREIYCMAYSGCPKVYIDKQKG